MTTLNRLKSEAKAACVTRKHQMENFRKIQYQSNMRFVWRARCKVCGAEVDVQPKPEPNEINVGGPAVAVNCIPPAK